MALEKLAGSARTCTLFWIVGALVGCSASGNSASTHPVERTASVSQAITSQNGFGQNGLTTNGLISNGFISNGFISNGFISNGFISNGLVSNGFISNGFISNGFISNGFISNGFISNGFISNGLVPNGFISNGFISNGFISNGVWLNGAWTNGFISNGFISNGFISNGLMADRLKSSQYARQLLQYIYSCGMPAGREASVDLWNGTQACGDGGTCDVGFACSPSGTCVLPLPGPGLGPGGQSTNPDGTTIPGRGLIGLGVNADGTHWWDASPSGDGGTSGNVGGPGDAGDGGTATFAGLCDETCQRWVSACVLARTNAYGVHVELSMRAPDSAPQQIKDALSTSFPEVTPCAQAGLDASDPSCGYTLREGAYYGNIFATTPALCDSTGCSPAAPPASGDGPATGPIAQTPSYYACAGPGSNIPEITKRFCSSQGDQVVIHVPGVCLTNAAGEQGTCDGQDSDANGAIRDCHTAVGTTADPDGGVQHNGTHYGEVISVYLKEPLAVCGNAVCEVGEDDPNKPMCSTNASVSPCYCPSDCHPGTWAKSFSAFDFTGTLFSPSIPTTTLDYPLPRVMLAVAPDNSIVSVAGDGTVARYAPDGSQLWTYAANDIFIGALPPPPVAIDLAGNIYSTLGGEGLGGWSGSIHALADGHQAGTFPMPSFSSPINFQTSGPVRIAIDSQGNIIMAASYQGTGTFGQFSFHSDSNGDIDVFVAKVSANGTPLWAESLGLGPFSGGTATPQPVSLVVSHADAGSCGQAGGAGVQGDGGVVADNLVLVTSGNGGTNPGLWKLCGANGSVLWTKPPMGAWFSATAVDPSGNIYATGAPGMFLPGGAGLEPFLTKYDLNGNILWTKYASVACGSGNEYGACFPSVQGVQLAFDPSNNVVVAMTGDPGIGGSIDFGVGSFPSYHAPNIFLAAYSPDTPDGGSGGAVWAKQIPTILYSQLYDMALDNNGRVVMGGAYSGSMQTDDTFLVTDVPETLNHFNPFLSSFAEPPPSDTTPPGIGVGPDHNTVPPHIVVDATSAAGAIVFFMPPTAIDTDNAGTSVVCNPPSNTMFKIGDTTVICTASDPQGNKSDPGAGSFTVTVRDTFGPAFTPSTVTDITRPATSASGAVVSFSPLATDVVDGPITPVCKPLSGTVFQIGTSPVVCTASDKAGNQSVAAFTVTVTAAPCSTDVQCASGSLRTPFCTAGACRACTTDIECAADYPSTPVCVISGPQAGACGNCASDVQCAALSSRTPLCGAAGCAGCTSNAQCAASNAATPVCVTSGPSSGSCSPLPVVACVGSPSSPVVVPVPQGVCGVAVSSASATAGACSGGAGGLTSCTFDGQTSETLSVGIHSIALLGTASDGSTANCTSYVSVVDNQNPTIQCNSQTLECTGNSGATSTPTATCSDNCSCTASCTMATFPLGTTPGSCSATDPSRNTASCQPNVTVVDTRPPVVTARSAPSQLQCGVDKWTDPGATALDHCAGDLSANVKASGIVDPMHVGSYAVSYSAVDPSGNVGSAGRAVTVIDTLAPSLTLPGTITTTVASSVGTQVTYSVSATDRCDGAVAPSCVPASGSTFAPGVTSVTCTATDAHGNKATGAFQVQMQYAWSGILQPINPDGSSIFKLGRTVPVKFQLTGASAGITNAVATLSVAQVSSNVTGTYVEAVSTSAASSGNTFRYDSSSGQYIFNMATKGLSTGTWRLLVDLHDGASHTILISLR